LKLRCVNILAIFASTTNDNRQHSSSTSNSQSQTDAETDVKLKSIEKSFRENEEAVVKKILDRVVRVDVQLHRNLKI
jgi:V-type H+-transporting ATPase subunit G